MSSWFTAVAAALATVIGGGLGAGSAQAATFPVSVTGQAVTRPLAANFLGLALEYSTVPQWTAQPGQASDTALNGLIKGLSPTGHPSVRIGGQSTDRSWWPVRGVKQPVGVTYDLGPSWARSARELATGAGVQLLLGVNLEAGSPLIARVEADELVKHVGYANIQSLAIGNEPNLYRFTPWYRESGGHILPWYSKTGSIVYSRPASWSPSAFVSQFDQFARQMPNLPLAGPETNPGPWLTAFDSLVHRHSRVSTITTHAYGLNNCDKTPGTPKYPTVAHLLTPLASRGLLDGIGPSIALARGTGASLRIDEMGSITCNGKPGVSDTFASALWAADALFAAARDGVTGVNLHSFPDSDNGLFDLSYDKAARSWRASVHPIYDGAYLFAQAAPAGSRILHTISGTQDQMRAWATLAPDHKVRVLLINDSESSSTLVPIHTPAGYGTMPATVERLTAPSAGAIGGIELGGYRFSSTTTGVPHTPVLGTLHPKSGVDTISLAPASAALVTLSPNSK